MKEYKEGDIVTIKSLDWYNEHKNKNGTVDVPGDFIEDMSEHCGKTTVITKVLDTPNRYYVECDPECWNWSAEMFEETKEETMKYKVGDKVRIQSQEWYDNHEKDDDGFIRNTGKITFNPEMCKYLGKIATITSANFGYSIDLDQDYWAWDDYMFECKVNEVVPRFEVGDFVQIKSEEWFEENKDEDGEIIENGLTFDENRCGLIGKITEYDSSDDTYKVELDPDDDEDIVWITINWADKVDKPCHEEEDEESEDDESLPIYEGDWVMVADKYSEEGPREDWTIAKFVAPRSRGIDTELGIWNYCIEWSDFDPEYWEETIKCIYTGKDKKLIKADE